jgi:para-nitrobenzyl esterase
MRTGVRVALGLIVGVLSLQTLDAQVVGTAYGKVEGQKDAAGAVTVFKGIPYATAPVGELRWRAPEAPAAWTGIRKADDFGAACMQRITREQFGPWTPEFLTLNRVSEDCLFLNIWTPKLSSTAGLPVVVFIHGGGFTSGAADVAVYDGAHLAAKGLVVITINYRLGVFGFLAHPELTAESAHHSSGNYALLDQMAALKWVKENVKNFGGDPERVTIWGQSAGAFSVGALVASPLAAGLFERAQADSGLAINGLPIEDLKDAEKKGSEFAAAHHAATLKEMRALPAEGLLPAPGAMGPGFVPIVDGWVIPDTPGNLSREGKDNDVPMITGYEADDSMTFFAPVTTTEAYDKMAKKQYGTMAGEFEKLYPAANADEVKAMVKESNRDRDRVAMYVWASERVKHHKQPVYTYFFTRAIPWPQQPQFGAFHTGELPYFFENLKVLDRPYEAVDFKVSETVSSYLKNFASAGDPNGAGLPHWMKIEAGKPETMDLGALMGPLKLAQKAREEFWVRYFNSPESRNAPIF